jgi:hypothetical protein
VLRPFLPIGHRSDRAGRQPTPLDNGPRGSNLSGLGSQNFFHKRLYSVEGLPSFAPRVYVKKRNKESSRAPHVAAVGVMGEVEGRLPLVLGVLALRDMAATPVAAETLAVARTTWSGNRNSTISRSAVQAGLPAKPVYSTPASKGQWASKEGCQTTTQPRLDASRLGPSSARAYQKLAPLGPSLTRLVAPASRQTKLGPSFLPARCNSVQLASLAMAGD